jgi:hypothetical protein
LNGANNSTYGGEQGINDAIQKRADGVIGGEEIRQNDRYEHQKSQKVKDDLDNGDEDVHMLYYSLNG